MNMCEQTLLKEDFFRKSNVIMTTSNTTEEVNLSPELSPCASSISCAEIRIHEGTNCSNQSRFSNRENEMEDHEELPLRGSRGGNNPHQSIDSSKNKKCHSTEDRCPDRSIGGNSRNRTASSRSSKTQNKKCRQNPDTFDSASRSCTSLPAA